MSPQPYQLTLVSHHLCPFVQRAVIALNEMGVDYTRKDIDLSNKPDWFLKISPLGLVPVLVVDEQTVIFESAVIAEFSNDVGGSQLLSQDIVEKAKQRAWVEYAAATFGVISQLYNGKDQQAFEQALEKLQQKWAYLEDILPDGGFFCGETFSLVDCAFAPFLRYFDILEKLGDWTFIPAGTKMAAYRDLLRNRPAVKDAVGAEFSEGMIAYIAAKDSWMAEFARAYLENKQV